jgi:hypothetical protein
MSTTITCETPSGTLCIEKPDCIGSYYIVYVPQFKERLLCTCIDASTDGRPKRMRVQQSVAHGGIVLEPHQYEVIEKNPLWED